MNDRNEPVQRHRRMTTEPVSRLIPRLAIPTIISMLVTALYNMVDTYFVGKINTSATGAVGIAFSLMTIIQVIGMILGVGSGSYMAASFVMNVNLRSEGSAVLGMLGIASGAVLNIALDPLFMFVFGMGIAGAAVAGMSVVTRIILFINSVMLGFGQGFQPVAAFNYTAGKKDRVHEAFWFSVRVGTAFLSVFALIAGAFAPWIIRVFRDDVEVVQVGAFALRMQSIALPLSAYIIISNMMFQYIGKPGKSHRVGRIEARPCLYSVDSNPFEVVRIAGYAGQPSAGRSNYLPDCRSSYPRYPSILEGGVNARKRTHDPPVHFHPVPLQSYAHCPETAILRACLGAASVSLGHLQASWIQSGGAFRAPGDR